MQFFNALWISLAALELTQHILLLLNHFLLKSGTKSFLLLNLFGHLGVFRTLLEHGFLELRIGNLLLFLLFINDLLFGLFTNVLVLFKVLAKEPFWLLLVFSTFVSVSQCGSYLRRCLNLRLSKLFSLELLYLLLHLLRHLWLFCLLRFFDNSSSLFGLSFLGFSLNQSCGFRLVLD